MSTSHGEPSAESQRPQGPRQRVVWAPDAHTRWGDMLARNCTRTNTLRHSFLKAQSYYLNKHWVMLIVWSCRAHCGIYITMCSTKGGNNKGRSDIKKSTNKKKKCLMPLVSGWPTEIFSFNTVKPSKDSECWTLDGILWKWWRETDTQFWKCPLNNTRRSFDWNLPTTNLELTLLVITKWLFLKEDWTCGQIKY